MRANDPHSCTSSPHPDETTLDRTTSSRTASSTGRSVSLQVRGNSNKRLDIVGSSLPRTPTSSGRPRWDCSPRLLFSQAHNSNMSSNGGAVEQLQAPLQGTGPKRTQSKGGRSKKHLAEHAVSTNGEQVTGQQDLIAAVTSNGSSGTPQQEGLQNRQMQQQQQEQQPYELQKEEGSSVSSAGKLTAADTIQHGSTAAAAPAAVPKLPLSRTGTDSIHTSTAAAGSGWPGSSIPVPPLPAALLPAVNSCAELTQGQLDVLGAWYCLYCPQPEAQQAVALARRYDERAGFEDNFVRVFGREQIGVMFYLMRRATSGISMAIEKIEVLRGSSSSSSDTYKLRIVGRHSFFFPPIIRGPVTSLLLPPALEAWATDELTVRASDHMVLHHLQRVHNIPTMPWLLRSCLGVSGSMLMMHVLGW